MILRRNNLQNKSPKSKVSLKKIHAKTKKYCSEKKHSSRQKKASDNTNLSKVKDSNKTNKDLQRSKTKTGKSLVSPHMLKRLLAGNSISKVNDYNISSTDGLQPTVSLRRISSRFIKTNSKSEKTCEMKKQSSASFSGENDCPTENGSQASSWNESKPFVKAKANKKINSRSQGKEEKCSSTSKKKNISKKAHSMSCLDDLNSPNLDDPITYCFRTKLRSSTSSIDKNISTQLIPSTNSLPSASKKVSKLELAKMKTAQPIKTKCSEKTVSKEIRNPKAKGKVRHKSRDKPSKLPNDSEEGQSLVLSKIDNLFNAADSSKEISQGQRNKRNCSHSQEVKRSTRSSRKSTPSGIEMKKDNLTINSSKAGRKKKDSSTNSTKQVEKNVRSKKSQSKEMLNTIESHAMKKKQKPDTLPKMKKATSKSNSTSLSRTVLSKSLTQKKLQGFRYHLNSIPMDDLTTSFSTPPTVERLYSSSLGKRKSILTTPFLQKKPAKLSNSSVDKNLIPGKGSLKRKRWVLNSLKGRNEGHEDDLFENCDLEEPLLLDDSDMSDVSIATPKCGFMVTPQVRARSPRFKDCYSPTELHQARKVAEEYMHRRNKKRRSCSAVEDMVCAEKKTRQKSNVTNADLESKKIELLEFIDTLNKKKNFNLKDDSEDEDDYCNDISF